MLTTRGLRRTLLEEVEGRKRRNDAVEKVLGEGWGAGFGEELGGEVEGGVYWFRVNAFYLLLVWYRIFFFFFKASAICFQCTCSSLVRALEA